MVTWNIIKQMISDKANIDATWIVKITWQQFPRQRMIYNIIYHVRDANEVTREANIVGIKGTTSNGRSLNDNWWQELELALEIQIKYSEYI